MCTSRSHGLVRRPLLAIATIVLLANGYASSYCGAHWLFGRRLITPRVYELLNESVYYPMQSYISQDWPGSRTIRIMSIWCMFDGGGNRLTWDEAAGWVEPIQW